MKRPTANLTDTYQSKVVKYIPTEIIAANLAITGFVKALPVDQQKIWMWIVPGVLLVLTPFYLHASTKRPSGTASPAHVVAGVLAFSAWVFANGGPFEQFKSWYSRPLGSIVLVLVCMCLPLVERMFPVPKDE